MSGTKPLLAATPPMGWMSWNLLGKNVEEAAIKAMADAMVESHGSAVLRLLAA